MRMHSIGKPGRTLLCVTFATVCFCFFCYFSSFPAYLFSNGPAHRPAELTAAASSLQGGPSVADNFKFAELPANPKDAQLAIVTDKYRGLYRASGGQWIHVGHKEFNVFDYGAVGDGKTDDSDAFQTAINDAIAVSGSVVIPPPSNNWLLKKTLVIQPGGSTGSGAGQCRIRMRGMGHSQAIQWGGGSNTSVFILRGLKDSAFENLNVQVNNGVQGVVVFDAQPTAAAASSSWTLWKKCRVNFSKGIGGLSNCIGWRTGQSAPTGGASDLADWVWEECQCSGQGKAYGDIGWHLGANQGKPQTFVNCGVGNVTGGYLVGPIETTLTQAVDATETRLNVTSTSTFPTSGTLRLGNEQITYTGVTPTAFTGCTRGANGTTADRAANGAFAYQYVTTNNMGVFLGGGETIWIGGGSSITSWDFKMTGTTGVFAIRGPGRYESGGTFLQSALGARSSGNQITVSDVVLAGYNPAVSTFIINDPTSLVVENLEVYANNAPMGSSFLKLPNSSANYGTVKFLGGAIYGTDPLYNSPVNWFIDFEGVRLTNAKNQPIGYFGRPPRRPTIHALTHGPNVTVDPRKGELMELAVTDARPFTLANPVVAHPGHITLIIANRSRGRLGAMTFGNNFVLTGGRWIEPAPGKRRSITFLCDGKNYFEQFRSAQDF